MSSSPPLQDENQAIQLAIPQLQSSVSILCKEGDNAPK